MNRSGSPGRLPSEVGCGFFRMSRSSAQHAHFFAELRQFLALGSSQAFPSPVIDISLSDPSPHHALRQVQIPADLRHRLARTADQPDRLGLELLAELSSALCCCSTCTPFLRVLPS